MPKAKDAIAQLADKFGGTGYAPRGALLVAKLLFDTGDKAGATAQLNFVLDRGAEDELKQIARFRLAAIQFDAKQYDDALRTLDAKHDEPFAGVYADLRGDILAAAGRGERGAHRLPDRAREARLEGRVLRLRAGEARRARRAARTGRRQRRAEPPDQRACARSRTSGACRASRATARRRNDRRRAPGSGAASRSRRSPLSRSRAAAVRRCRRGSRRFRAPSFGWLTSMFGGGKKLGPAARLPDDRERADRLAGRARQGGARPRAGRHAERDLRGDERAARSCASIRRAARWSGASGGAQARGRRRRRRDARRRRHRQGRRARVRHRRQAAVAGEGVERGARSAAGRRRHRRRLDRRRPHPRAHRGRRQDANGSTSGPTRRSRSATTRAARRAAAACSRAPRAASCSRSISARATSAGRATSRRPRARPSSSASPT